MGKAAEKWTPEKARLRRRRRRSRLPTVPLGELLVGGGDGDRLGLGRRGGLLPGEERHRLERGRAGGHRGRPGRAAAAVVERVP